MMLSFALLSIVVGLAGAVAVAIDKRQSTTDVPQYFQTYPELYADKKSKTAEHRLP